MFSLFIIMYFAITFDMLFIIIFIYYFRRNQTKYTGYAYLNIICDFQSNDWLFRCNDGGLASIVVLKEQDLIHVGVQHHLGVCFPVILDSQQILSVDL